MDIFIEHFVKRKKDLRDWLLKIEIIIMVVPAIAIAFVLLLEVLPGFVWQLFPFTVAGIIYGAYRAVSSLNVEFEYTLTNRELDIDKITAKKRRKRLLSVDCREMLWARPYGERRRAGALSGFKKTLDARGGAGAPAYIAAFKSGEEKVALVFEPPGEMLKAISAMAPGKVAGGGGQE